MEFIKINNYRQIMIKLNVISLSDPGFIIKINQGKEMEALCQLLDYTKYIKLPILVRYSSSLTKNFINTKIPPGNVIIQLFYHC